VGQLEFLYKRRHPSSVSEQAFSSRRPDRPAKFVSLEAWRNVVARSMALCYTFATPRWSGMERWESKSMKKVFPITIIFSICLMAGCSGVPSQESALASINSSYGASPRSLTFKIGRVGPNCYFLSSGQQVPADLTPQRDMPLTILERAGYVTVTPDGKDFWKVELSEKGRALQAKHEQVFLREPYGHETGNGCDYYQVDLPVARAVAVQISAMRPGESSCEYDFSWHWQPTELASFLEQDSEIFSKLTPQQKEQLSKQANAYGDSPPLPLPFPANAGNVLAKRTAIFRKHDKGWSFDFQHP
jgi:DNA-binding MarR family transcriptional regulator